MIRAAIVFVSSISALICFVLGLSISSVLAAAESRGDRALIAQSRLALGVLERLHDKADASDTVFSPASTAELFKLISRGGGLEFRASVHKFFGSPGARLGSRLAGDKGPVLGGSAIFLSASINPHPYALNVLSHSGIYVDTLDFSKASAVDDVNSWVAKNTAGKIPRIVETLSSEDGMIALNAIYFKDKWKKAFALEDTRIGQFFAASGEIVNVPLMHASDVPLRVRQDNKFVAVDLAYATDRFSLVLLTTKERSAEVNEFSGLAGWLAARDFVDSEAELTMPRFSASASIDLMPTMLAMGLRPPGSLPHFASGSVQLSRMQQRVELKVDEEGTEGAVATAMTSMRSSERSTLRVVIDRPFMFALRDNRTHLILAAGYVGKPESAQ